MSRSSRKCSWIIQNLPKPPFMRICRRFENWRDLRASSGKLLRQKSCYPESFRFLWLWEGILLPLITMDEFLSTHILLSLYSVSDFSKTHFADVCCHILKANNCKNFDVEIMRGFLYVNLSTLNLIMWKGWEEKDG